MNTFPLLLVEDDVNDLYFFERAAAKAGVTNPLHTVRDGQQAISYLAGAGEYADRQRFPKPGIVFLDLNLPVKHGLDVLKWIRANPETKTLIVIVLTSSSAELDVDETYRFGANAYLVKPADPTSLTGMLGAIKGFWLAYNQPPPRDARG
jgi:CheY-like chemotaxis protein